MKLILKISIALLLPGTILSAWAQNNPPVQCPCCTSWCEVVLGPTGGMTFTDVQMEPGTNACLGDWFQAWVGAVPQYSTTVKVTKWADEVDDCMPMYYTNGSYPSFVTNWCVVSSPGFSGSTRFYINEEVYFYPTNCGSGTITFYGTWAHLDPCSADWIGGGTISKSLNFTVVNVQILEEWKSVCTNGTTSFSLTNTCGPVTWSVSPQEQDGPYADGSTIVAGTKSGSWTVTATSTLNTNCTASATLYVVDIDSYCVAATPSDKYRTTIGVGEEVILTVSGNPPGEVTWSTSAGTLLYTNATATKLTAPERQTNPVTVTMQHSGGAICEKKFDVIEPTSEIAYISSTDYYPPGVQGVGMQLVVTVQPTTVSFYRVDGLEFPCPATSIWGYFTNFPASSLEHNPNLDWVPLDESNRWGDHAAFWNKPPPWTAGGYQWIIPVTWMVRGSNDAVWLPDRTQTHTIAGADGTSIVTKLECGTMRTP
jgi:hypothetical protein